MGWTEGPRGHGSRRPRDKPRLPPPDGAASGPRRSRPRVSRSLRRVSSGVPAEPEDASPEAGSCDPVSSRTTVERVCRTEPIYTCADVFHSAIEPVLHSRVRTALQPLVRRLCDEGDALSCILRCRFSGPAFRSQACDDACATGRDPAICFQAKQRANRFGPGSAHLAPAWFAVATDACDHGVAIGCRDSALPTWVQGMESPDRNFARFVRGCALGDSLSCTTVAYSPLADEVTRARAQERSCALGSRFACEVLCTDSGSTSEEPSQVGATCERVISFICATVFRGSRCTAQWAFDRVRVREPDDEFARAYLAGLRDSREADRDPDACHELSVAYAAGRITRRDRRIAGRYRNLGRRYERARDAAVD